MFPEHIIGALTTCLLSPGHLKPLLITELSMPPTQFCIFIFLNVIICKAVHKQLPCCPTRVRTHGPPHSSATEPVFICGTTTWGMDWVLPESTRPKVAAFLCWQEQF